MSEKVAPYIKDKDGSLLPVVAIYDKDGNDITKTYAKKQNESEVRIYRDSNGFFCYDDINKEDNGNV